MTVDNWLKPLTCVSTKDGDPCVFWENHSGFHFGRIEGAWGYSEGDEQLPRDPLKGLVVDYDSEEEKWQ